MRRNNTCEVVFIVQLPTPLKAAPAQRLHTFCKHLMRIGLRTCIAGGINVGEVLSYKLGVATRSIIGDTKRKGHKLKCHELNISLYFMVRIPYISNIINKLLSFSKIIYLIVRKPKVMIVSVPPADLVLATFLASRIIKSIFIVDIRDPAEELMYYYSSKTKLGSLLARVLQRINYAIYRHADAIIFASNSIAEMLKKHGIHGFVIPNGADLKIFRPIEKKYTKDLKTLTLVFLSTAAGYYDPRPLILALKFLNDSGFKIRLLLVGAVRKTVKEFIERIDAKDYISYLGFYPPEDLALKIFPRCDIGVIPRVSDHIFDYAIPAKFYEYVASGLPVFALCRKESELAKIIMNYDIGWICEYEDISCILQTLKEVYLDRTLLNKKRNNALALRHHFDRDVYAYKIVKLLEILLQKKK